MSKRIDELMRISDRGFVDEYDDIKVILNNFLNYSMEELSNALPEGCDLYGFADNAAQKFGGIKFNDRESLEKLHLSDLLCIMKYFEDTFNDSTGVLLSYLKNLRNNIFCLKNLPWAKLFLSISVKSLMDFLDKECGAYQYSAIYRSMCGVSKECSQFELSENTTLKQLLDGTGSALFASWNPCYDKELYFETIESACLIIKFIFINGTAAWCYDKSEFLEFLEKYETEFDIMEDLPID